jgi:prepilin-type N-terminal cleavage/methylation domain-containing protein
MKQTSKTSAFTLIELLVVISIIAILASIAIPVFSSASLTAQQNKAQQQCKGIFYGLKMFATDHNGIYPSSPEQDFQQGSTANNAPLTDANIAFANIVPTYVNSEKPFSVTVSRYCKTASGSLIVPDDNFANRSLVLAAGQNAFAYVTGLNDTSNSNYPIMADGFNGGAGIVAAPKYSKSDADYGGVWKGRKAIVVRLDGSVNLESINQTTLVVQRPGPGQMNLFQPVNDPNNPWLVGSTILNPKQPE